MQPPGWREAVREGCERIKLGYHYITDILGANETFGRGRSYESNSQAVPESTQELG